MKFKTIKDLCTVTKGTTGILKAIDGEYPLVVTSEERKSNNEYQFDTKAVIVPLVSSTGHGHASLKRIHYQEGKFAVGSILCAIVPKDESVLSAEFLYHYLDLNKERELVSKMKGMANVTLPIKEIENIPIPILTINEQLDFIEYYSTIENHSVEISSEITHQLDLIKDLRKAFLREAMQGLLVGNETQDGATGADLLAEIQTEKNQLVKEKKIKKPKPFAPIAEDELPYVIPENWTWCRLGEIIELKSGQDLTPSEYNDKGMGIPYVTGASNIEEGNLNINRWTAYPKSIAEKGELLLTCKGTIGKMSILNIERVHIARQLMSIKCPYLFNNVYYVQFVLYLSIKSFQIRSKSLIPGIDRDMVLNELIPLPPLEIQERIVAKLDELMAVCDALETQVKQSQHTNEQLLQQVLREALGA